MSELSTPAAVRCYGNILRVRARIAVEKTARQWQDRGGFAGRSPNLEKYSSS